MNVTTSSNSKAEEAVLEVIERELAIPRARVQKTDDLVKDLGIDTDDLSFLFVPGLEKKLGKKVPVSEWDTVFTVQDAIDLLTRYSGNGDQ